MIKNTLLFIDDYVMPRWFQIGMGVILWLWILVNLFFIYTVVMELIKVYG